MRFLLLYIFLFLWYNRNDDGKGVEGLARKAVRDWITNEEAGKILGISRQHFFKTYCLRNKLLNSVCVGHVWLHYLPDVLKVKEKRDKDPWVIAHRKPPKPAKISRLIPEAEGSEGSAKPAKDAPEA